MATNIAQAFNEFKSRLELSQTLQDVVSTHHNAIRSWIKDCNPSIETKLVGSLQRKTRIQPRPLRDDFDIDILVVFGSFNRWVSSEGVLPADALEKLENIVSQNETYKRMGPETESPTVIMEYTDRVKVELIPVYRDQIGYTSDGLPLPPVGRGYWIPKHNKWIIADYDYDAEYISRRNDESEKYLIPTIKMLKSAKRNTFPDMRSYHLEVLATKTIPGIINYFKNENLPISYPELIYLVFVIAKDSILSPVQIPGSKSPSASEYMSIEKRQELSKMFSVIADHCKSLFNLNNREAIEGWKSMFGEPFPAYG